MITNELKSQVDKIWQTFWTGGISNPLTVVVQFTFLKFIKSLDTAQTKIDKKKRLDSSIKDIFTKENEHLRWQNDSLKTAEDMFATFQTEMFKFKNSLRGKLISNLLVITIKISFVNSLIFFK